MKYIFAIAGFLFCLLANSQEYLFDYVLDVQYQKAENDSTMSYKIYTNSRDNEFYLRLEHFNDNEFKLNFIDTRRSAATDTIPKGTFTGAKTYTISSSKVWPYHNPYLKKQLKHYRFEVFNDTIIDDVAYYHYAVKPINRKRARRKKIGDLHYIVDKNTEFHVPVFLHQTASVTLYSNGGKVPSGVFKEKYFIMPDGKKMHLEKRIKLSKTDLKLTADCCSEIFRILVK